VLKGLSAVGGPSFLVGAEEVRRKVWRVSTASGPQEGVLELERPGVRENQGGRSSEMDIVEQIGEVQGWHLDIGSEYGRPNRVATKYKEGRRYEIESQLVWYEHFEGEEVPKAEQWLSVSIGRYGGIESLSLDVLVWLMTGQTRASRRVA